MSYANCPVGIVSSTITIKIKKKKTTLYRPIKICGLWKILLSLPPSSHFFLLLYPFMPSLLTLFFPPSLLSVTGNAVFHCSLNAWVSMKNQEDEDNGA